VDVPSSIELNDAEDVDLPERQRDQHYSSWEVDSGFDDCSGHSTSDGGESPETDEELSAKKQLVKLSTRKLLVKEPSGKKQSRRKAKLNILIVDTGGREADLVSADTSATFAAQVGGPTKSASTPAACCTAISSWKGIGIFKVPSH
jgi:hypothetical protein